MNKSKVAFFKSIRLKIQLLSIVGVTISIILLIVLSLPRISENITSIIQSYMKSEASINGKILATEVTNTGTDVLADFDYLDSLLGDIKINDIESSYAYLVSSNGTMMYHPTPEKIGAPVENSVVRGLVADIAGGLRNSLEVVEYEYKGAIKYAAYYINDTADFILVVTSDEKEVMVPIEDAQKRMIVSGIIVFLLCLVASELLSRKIVAAMNKAVGIVNSVSELDLSEDDNLNKIQNRSDEIGLIGKSLANLKVKLKGTLSVMQEQSNKLTSSTDVFLESFDEISEAIKGINVAVEGIAMGSMSLAQEVSCTQDMVSNIAEAIDCNGESVTRLEGCVNNMMEYSNKASDEMEGLEDVSNMASKAIGEVVIKNNMTNESVHRIENATKVIQQIASQTKLLSFNARIEAARAGDAGRGFAVVADEIQKLADSSDNSANEISSVLVDLLERSNDTVNNIRIASKNVDLQLDKLASTKRSFTGLQSEIELVSTESKGIGAQVTKIDENKNVISTTVQQLAAISEENAAGTEETSASMQSFMDIIDKCKELSNGLAVMSQAMRDEAAKFKT